MKAGDKVILDDRFANRSIVTIVWILRYLSKVRDEHEGEWEVMTCRLSELPF